MTRSKVTVVGSLNMDLVSQAKRLPEVGETILGEKFSTIPGGKGNNQAIACARLGAEVTIIGCVGNDTYGERLIAKLTSENVNVNHIFVLPDVGTGIASIMTTEEDNQIIVIPGANNSLTPERVEEKESVIRESDIILIQLEIPLETVVKTLEIAERYDIPVILNPAPATLLKKSIVEKVSILTPNEHELVKLFEADDPSITQKEILQAYPQKIVMTKGKEGAYFADAKRNIVHVPGYDVSVVDTTGAGDAFNGALAFQLSIGNSLNEATDFAVAAGALAVMEFGAQGGLPTIEEVNKFLDLRAEKKENSF